VEPILRPLCQRSKKTSVVSRVLSCCLWRDETIENCRRLFESGLINHGISSEDAERHGGERPVQRLNGSSSEMRNLGEEDAMAALCGECKKAR
jgi:hypothetical protein